MLHPLSSTKVNNEEVHRKDVSNCASSDDLTDGKDREPAGHKSVDNAEDEVPESHPS